MSTNAYIQAFSEAYTREIRKHAVAAEEAAEASKASEVAEVSDVLCQIFCDF